MLNVRAGMKDISAVSPSSGSPEYPAQLPSKPEFASLAATTVSNALARVLAHTTPNARAAQWNGRMMLPCLQVDAESSQTNGDRPISGNPATRRCGRAQPQGAR